MSSKYTKTSSGWAAAGGGRVCGDPAVCLGKIDEAPRMRRKVEAPARSNQENLLETFHLTIAVLL
jgi:hypothetical protein